MQLLLASFVVGGIVALAAPSPTSTLSCGDGSHCFDETVAEAPCVTSYVPSSGETIVDCNVATFWAWPSIVSWEQCQARCKSEKGCKSFSYEFYEPIAEENEDTADGVYCQLYNHTVTSYSKTCKKGDTNLSIFWDANCPAPSQLTTGTVPKAPDTDAVNGTCGGQRIWNGNNAQWNHITLQAEAINKPLAACATACGKHALCKSYYWANATEGYFDPALSDDQFYPPEQSNGFGPTLCLLLSQPVKSYTIPPNDPYYLDENNQFYDRNCPV